MKDFNVGNLLEVYAPVLQERDREAMTCYYHYDMSLAEISERIGLSRQGVREIILRATRTLNDLEHALELYAKLREATAVCESNPPEAALDKVRLLFNF